MNNHAKLVSAGVLLAVLSCFVLCGSSVLIAGEVATPAPASGAVVAAVKTFQAQVTNGMSKADVIAVLGKPCGEVAKDKHATLYFTAGDVIELEDGKVQSTSAIFVRQGVDPLPQPQTSAPPMVVTPDQIVPGYRNVEFGDSKWEIVKALELGRKLASNQALCPDLKTKGKYIHVAVKVTNKTEQAVRSFAAPVLVDDQNREFGEIDNQAYYLPENAKTNGASALPPSIPKVFHAIFEVAADSHDLKYRARELKSNGDSCDVPLKMP